MFNPKYHMTEGIAKDISAIELLLHKVTDSRMFLKFEKEIRERATVEATHSSVSIENNPLDIREVSKVINNKIKLSRHQYAEIEARNYKSALDFIAKRKLKKDPISTQDISDLHHEITKDLLDKSRSGKWRKNPVYIEKQDGTIAYSAVSPQQIPEEIDNLIHWLNTEATSISPTIAAGILHLQFVTIHPFSDGNGRTARALTMLYLGLREADCRGTLVLDSYYAYNRREYYDALHSAQGKTYKESQSKDITNWLTYFVSGMLSSVKILNAEIKILNANIINGEKTTLSINA